MRLSVPWSFFCFISDEDLKMGIQEQRDKTVGRYKIVDKV